MAVKALKPYDFPARDRTEVFGSDQLIYLYVPNHYWFCSAACFRVGKQMTFQQLWDGILAPFVAADPELAGKNWRQGRWSLMGEPFEPQTDQALVAQGIRHKTFLTWEPA